jgi:hypothetical protein
MILTIVCGVLWELRPDVAKSLILWCPRRDLNPCYRRESISADISQNVSGPSLMLHQ